MGGAPPCVSAYFMNNPEPDLRSENAHKVSFVLIFLDFIWSFHKKHKNIARVLTWNFEKQIFTTGKVRTFLYKP